jgi:hypothetical protein
MRCKRHERSFDAQKRIGLPRIRTAFREAKRMRKDGYLRAEDQHFERPPDKLRLTMPMRVLSATGWI